MEKKILYIDLDGVCADFESAVHELDPNIFSLHHDRDQRSKMIDDICEANPYIFHELPPMKGAVEAVKNLFELYEVYFLSTPMWNVPLSFTGKRLWIEQHFGEVAKKRLILTHRKDLNMGDYLIDDRIKNGVDKFKGQHIHFGTEMFPDWNEVYEFLLKQFNASQPKFVQSDGYKLTEFEAQLLGDLKKEFPKNSIEITRGNRILIDGYRLGGILSIPNRTLAMDDYAYYLQGIIDEIKLQYLNRIKLENNISNFEKWQ